MCSWIGNSQIPRNDQTTKIATNSPLTLARQANAKGVWLRVHSPSTKSFNRDINNGGRSGSFRSRDVWSTKLFIIRRLGFLACCTSTGSHVPTCAPPSSNSLEESRKAIRQGRIPAEHPTSCYHALHHVQVAQLTASEHPWFCPVSSSCATAATNRCLLRARGSRVLRPYQLAYCRTDLYTYNAHVERAPGSWTSRLAVRFHPKRTTPVLRQE